MSATITTGKLAGAFKAVTGAILYVLFEETYEKNVTPHTPSWSCVYLGNLAGAIERIFLHASGCEGGGLQNRNGYITPEGYISGWLKELSEPAIIPDYRITLSVGEGFYTPIPLKSLEKTKLALDSIGRSDLATALETGNSVEVSLYGDAEALSSLYGPGGFSPWRVIQSYCTPLHQPRNAEFGYRPTPAKKFDVLHPAAIKVDGDVRLLQRPDGSWYCAGWEYGIVSRFIQDLHGPELTEPGSYRKKIKSYRDALRNAPMLPNGAKVVIDPSATMEEYQKNRVNELGKQVGADPSAIFEVAVTEANSYQLTGLPEVCATWVLPGSQTDMDQPEQAKLF